MFLNWSKSQPYICIYPSHTIFFFNQFLSVPSYIGAQVVLRPLIINMEAPPAASVNIIEPPAIQPVFNPPSKRVFVSIRFDNILLVRF